MSQGNYSVLDRLLHRIALSSPAVIAAAGRADGQVAPDDLPPDFERPVFVTGMARSGTTMLLELCHGTAAFHSQTYRDMPFVTAPNLWRRISGSHRHKGTLQERAHGDGLEISFDSVEAFEEIFWRGLLADAYITKGCLEPQEGLAEDDIESFRQFVARVLLTGPGALRYLSKNNNNLLRLGVLRTAFPQAAILIPFRDPESFVRSVLTQHERFLKLHVEDTFARNYMRWMGHFEFGLDYRPQNLPGVPRFSGSPKNLDRTYLLAYWNAVHDHLLAQDGLGMTLIDHVQLRVDPWHAIVMIGKHIGVSTERFRIDLIRPGKPVQPPKHPDCPEEAAAWATYSRLQAAAVNSL